MTENETKVTRDVSGLLLVKNSEGWRIAAQAWDYIEEDILMMFEAAQRSGEALESPPGGHPDA